MAQVTLSGTPFNLAGTLPKVGDKAPDFHLAAGDLSGVTLETLKGKKKVLVIVPSLDTPVCQTETRKFNEEAAGLENVAVLVASSDLPFAQSRFCSTEGLENVVAVSDLRDRGFGERYGVAIAEGPFAGVTARAIFVIDENDTITHVELVEEIANEPNYDAAIAAAKG